MLLFSLLCWTLGVVVQSKTVKYHFLVQEWVVDYLRPTTELDGVLHRRKTPFDIPAEVRKAALLVNGQYPGPTIECNENDTVVVTVENGLLDKGVTVHWHGVWSIGTPWYDGTVGVAQAPILPGQNMTYEFLAYPPGTHWWHSHMDALQVAKGLKGPLIIHSAKDPFEKMYQAKQILVLSDEWREPDVCLKLEGALPGNPVCAEVDKVSWNGQYGNGSAAYPFPVLEVAPDTCYRLRIINMGGSVENLLFTAAGHQLTLLAVDGEDVSPIPVQGLNIHNGERYDVLLCADQTPGNYLLNATYELACPLMKRPNPPGMPLVDTCYFFGMLKYTNHHEVAHTTDGTGGGRKPVAVKGPLYDLNSWQGYQLTQPLRAVAAPKVADVSYTMDMGITGNSKFNANTAPLSTNRWYMWDHDKRVTWTSPTTPLIFTHGTCGADKTPIYHIPETADTVEIIINNLSPTPHVLHMHGGHFQVVNFANFSWLGSSNVFFTPWFLAPQMLGCPKEDIVLSDPNDPMKEQGLWWGCAYNASKDAKRASLANPLRKDTIEVMGRAWAVIRVPASNPGFWLFHCHMEQHIPLGMITVLGIKEARIGAVPANVPSSGPCGSVTRSWDAHASTSQQPERRL